LISIHLLSEDCFGRCIISGVTLISSSSLLTLCRYYQVMEKVYGDMSRDKVFDAVHDSIEKELTSLIHKIVTARVEVMRVQLREEKENQKVKARAFKDELPAFVEDSRKKVDRGCRVMVADVIAGIVTPLIAALDELQILESIGQACCRTLEIYKDMLCESAVETLTCIENAKHAIEGFSGPLFPAYDLVWARLNGPVGLTLMEVLPHMKVDEVEYRVMMSLRRVILNALSAWEERRPTGATCTLVEGVVVWVWV
jgi:hypothetical protein